MRCTGRELKDDILAANKEVQKLCSEINNSLQAVSGWYELGDIRAAKEALYKLNVQVEFLYDIIERHDAERVGCTNA